MFTAGKLGLVVCIVTVGAACALAVPGHAQALGSWQLSGNMSAARYAPTATTLPDGRVLVAGGYNGSTCVKSADIYNGSAFTPTGGLSTGRNFATATLLNNGSVLVAGGYNTMSGTLSSAELYNPATGKFTQLRYSMKSRRELFTATMLPDGKVLLCGGYSTANRGPVNTAEIYDPANSKTPFASTGLMKGKRFGHAAVLIPGTTKILIVGGADAVGALNTAEIYDISTKTFVSVGPMSHARDRCTAVWIPREAKVLVIGGKDNTVPYEPLETEWFSLAANPASSTFSADGPALAQGRMAHTQTVLGDGSVLVAGGWNSILNSTTNTAERLVYDGTQYVFESAGAMAFDCHDHAAVLLLNGNVLVVGGKRIDQNPGGYLYWLNRSEIYTP